MKDLKILIYLDFLKLKNLFFQIFQNPIIFIKRLFTIIMLLAFIFSSYIISLFTNKAKTSITLETQEISLGIIAVISTIIILFVLAHYLNDYAPSNFSISDISYLFPSPLNNNLILLY